MTYFTTGKAGAKALQSLLGHSDIRLTMDLYAHLMPSTVKESTDALTRYLVRSLPSDCHTEATEPTQRQPDATAGGERESREAPHRERIPAS